VIESNDWVFKTGNMPLDFLLALKLLKKTLDAILPRRGPITRAMARRLQED